MYKNLKRCLSFLMVLVLMVGMLPTAYATEITDPTEPSTEPAPEGTSGSVETTAPEEPLETVTPTVETEPEESEAPEEATPEASEPVMEFAAVSNAAAMAASSQSGIMLFDFSDNGDYTTRLNSQLTVKYKPNGTGSAKTAYIKNLGQYRINATIRIIQQVPSKNCG